VPAPVQQPVKAPPKKQTKIDIPEVPDGTKRVKLAGPAKAATMAKSGQYLIFHLPSLRQLAVFDVKTAEVIKTLAMPTDDILLAGTSEKLIVVLKDRRLLQRYDLATWNVDTTIEVPQGGVEKIAAPAGAAGPVVMAGHALAKKYWLLDSATMKVEPFPNSIVNAPEVKVGPETIDVSFDGSHSLAFISNGYGTLEFNTFSAGKIVSTNRADYVRLPPRISGNGFLVFSNSSTALSADLKSEMKLPAGTPAVTAHPAFSITVGNNYPERGTVTVFANTDPRPLFSLPKLPELAKIASHGTNTLAMADRVFLVPHLESLVSLTPGDEELAVRPVKFAEMLAASGKDYLYVVTSPVWTAERGETLTYAMRAVTNKGGAKFELTKGPPGMTLADGKLTWAVPKDEAKPRHEVMVTVSDAAGQTCIHAFTVDIAGLQVAAPAAVRPSQPPTIAVNEREPVRAGLSLGQNVAILRAPPTGERAKGDMPTVRPVTTVRGLMVSQGPDGEYHGAAVDLLAVAAREQHQMITVRGLVGREMRVSMDEAIRLVEIRQPKFDRASIDLSFGEKYSIKDGGSAGTAVALLLLSAVGEFELNPDAAITGDITIDSKVRTVGEAPAKAHGAWLDKVKIVAIPEGNAAEFDDMMLLTNGAPFWEAHIFTVKNLDDAIAVMRKDLSPKLLEAMKLFDELKPEYSGKAPLALMTAGTKEKVAKILELAPNHLCAKNLQAMAMGKAPKTLSVIGTVKEAINAIVPMRRAAADKLPHPELAKNGTIPKARQALERLQRISDKAALPVVKAIDEYCGAYSTWALTVTDAKLTQADRDRVQKNLEAKALAIETSLQELFTDKEVLDKLMRE
jgi:hypothetical protein